MLILFSVNLEVVSALLESGPSTDSFAAHMLHVLSSCVVAPLLKVVLSAALGACGGLLLGLLQTHARSSLHPAAVLLLAASLFLSARALPAEPLLACVAAGALAANRREEQRDELHALLGGLMSPVNLAFFTLAGAALAVDALLGTAPIALVIHTVRLLALMCATHVASYGVPRELRRCIWMGMITQAGVALGLARTVLARFPHWGGDFYALMVRRPGVHARGARKRTSDVLYFQVATIMINQFVGPPLFRAAIVAVGEQRASRLPLTAPAAADGEAAQRTQ